MLGGWKAQGRFIYIEVEIYFGIASGKTGARRDVRQ